jgi:hypothetical protein
MSISQIYVKNVLKIEPFPCTGHKNTEQCFLYKTPKGQLIHVQIYDSPTTDCGNLSLTAIIPVRELARIYLNGQLDQLVPHVLHMPTKMLVQTELVNDIFIENPRAHDSLRANQVLKFTVQLYALYICLRKQYPCAGQQEFNPQEWQFVTDSSGNIQLLNGLSRKLSYAIVYTYKEHLKDELALDIASTDSGNKISKLLRSIIKQHKDHCARGGGRYSHHWINELNGPYLKILNRTYSEFKSSGILKTNPSVRISKGGPMCPNSDTYSCCFKHPNLVGYDAHSFICQNQNVKGLDLLKYGRRLNIPHCDALIAFYDLHKQCKYCKINV